MFQWILVAQAFQDSTQTLPSTPRTNWNSCWRTRPMKEAVADGIRRSANTAATAQVPKTIALIEAWNLNFLQGRTTDQQTDMRISAKLHFHWGQSIWKSAWSVLPKVKREVVLHVHKINLDMSSLRKLTLPVFQNIVSLCDKLKFRHTSLDHRKIFHIFFFLFL